MISIQFKKYQSILKKYLNVVAKLAILLFISFLSFVSVFSYGQSTPKVWNESNSELRITYPSLLELEQDGKFYLRYTQNLDSFDQTKSIDWNIKDIFDNVVYSRKIEGNQDKNEAVTINKPGKYTITLTLNTDSSIVSNSSVLKILPKDSKYFEGLVLTEIDFNNSQIEISNKSQNDIDSSSLLLNYNSKEGYDLGKLSIIPANSFTVLKLDLPLKSEDKIDLVFQKNLKSSSEVSISSFDEKGVLQLSPSSQTLQFDHTTNKWTWSDSTLGQENKFNSNPFTSEISVVRANFQKTDTERSGGFDISFLSLLPFIILGFIYLCSLIFEEYAPKNFLIKILNLSFLSPFLPQIIGFQIEFAKIKVCFQYFLAQIEVFGLSTFLRLQTI